MHIALSLILLLTFAFSSSKNHFEYMGNQNGIEKINFHLGEMKISPENFESFATSNGTRSVPSSSVWTFDLSLNDAWKKGDLTMSLRPYLHD